MSVTGSSLETAALQAIVAQQVASKARDKEKAESASGGGRKFNDLVELRVSGAESADAVRPIPHNDSEQADSEHDAQSHDRGSKTPDRDKPRARPRIDVKA